MTLTDASDEFGTIDENEMRARRSEGGAYRKSTCIYITDEMEQSQEKLYDMSHKSSVSQYDTKPNLYYCKPTNESFESLTNDEGKMESFDSGNQLKLPNFDESKDVNFRLCPQFHNEGFKTFKLTLKYKIIKVYEESRSDPITMSMTRLVKLQCLPPFEVALNYEVKDWLTNELNLNDQEISQTHPDVFVKVPAHEQVPLSISVTSLSESVASVNNVDLHVLNTHLEKNQNQNEFRPVQRLEEGDTVCAGFVIKAKK